MKNMVTLSLVMISMLSGNVEAAGIAVPIQRHVVHRILSGYSTETTTEGGTTSSAIIPLYQESVSTESCNVDLLEAMCNFDSYGTNIDDVAYNVGSIFAGLAKLISPQPSSGCQIDVATGVKYRTEITTNGYITETTTVGGKTESTTFPILSTQLIADPTPGLIDYNDALTNFYGVYVNYIEKLSPFAQTNVAVKALVLNVGSVLKTLTKRHDLYRLNVDGIVVGTTEILGGTFAIPETWAPSFPRFSELFGGDKAKAMLKPSGKTSADGSVLYVWQDYVAGTDPTDEDDTFRATVEFVGGVPVVGWTPKLSAVETARRKYTIWGKEKLQDEKWVEVPSGDEAKYNFFKVTVEMK